MSQESVYRCLEKYKRPMTNREIAECLNLGTSTVGAACKKLTKQGELHMEIVVQVPENGYPKRVHIYKLKEVR